LNPSRVWQVSASDAKTFVDFLFDPRRREPVVAVTTDPRDGTYRIDPATLVNEVGGQAVVVCLETGDPTWELTKYMPEQLGIFGGHARVWFPGLRPDSPIHEHPIVWVKTELASSVAFARLVSLVRRRAMPALTRIDARGRPEVGAQLSVMVRRIERDGRVAVASGQFHGFVPPHEIVAERMVDASEVVRQGQSLRVECLDVGNARTGAIFSVARANPSAWDRAQELFEPGDFVSARVLEVSNLDATLEILPGVLGVLHVRDMGKSVVHPSRVVREAQCITVRIRTLEVRDRKLELELCESVDAARYRSGSLLDGGPPFPPNVGRSQAGRVESDEVRALRADTAQLAGQLNELSKLHGQEHAALKDLRVRYRELKDELAVAQERVRELEAILCGGVDPIASNAAFRDAISRMHQAIYSAADRVEFPLRPFVVGGRFLESVRTIDRISVEKIVEVCTHVVSNRTDAVPGKHIHQLKESDAGPVVLRATDGARAWRCALQVGTPDARRLHWWQIPQGGTELAAVRKHDDMTIPE
jgi:predicted RNA-binding protein with RPS1 domain